MIFTTKSQINVIAAKLKTSDGQKLYVKIVTADSFRNSDQDIILADFVSVKSYLEGPADKRGACTRHGQILGRRGGIC